MTPSERLEQLLSIAKTSLATRASTEVNLPRIESVCLSLSNRACVRLLMSCMLAKLDRPDVDPRRPYTEIGTADCFSGRSYDEQHITRFVLAHRLPCNSTTAFLTPVLRNIGRPLTTDTVLLGKPRELYAATLELLAEVAEGRDSANAVLLDTLRILVQLRDSRLARLAELQSELRAGVGALPLSSEAIVGLIQQHLSCKHSSRLPVLIVSAAYHAAVEQLGEHVAPLQSHNAADEQTGAAGDVQIMLKNDDCICTVYEMKQKSVTVDDLDRALQKVGNQPQRIDNYLFMTTDRIDRAVSDYAATLYEATGGTEFVVLDCLGFVRHFLHLFHRRRIDFLDAYQSLVLDEPDSVVGMPLKEAFLALRRAAVESVE